MARPRPDFKVSFRRKDIFSIHVPRSGVGYAPELEWRLAAKEFNYTWEQFCRLDGQSQSSIIAAYRASNQIEAVVANEQAKASRVKRPSQHRK